MASEPWLLAESGSLVAGALCVLDRDEARHLASVLRCPAGTSVVLTDGCGLVANGVVRRAGRDRVEIDVLDAARSPRPAGPAVSIALAILNTAAMDWAVQKSVEVGAECFTPVVAERSQGGAAAGRRRLGHWRRVAFQALKQCHRPWGMEVTEPVEVGDLDDVAGPQLRLLADPAGEPALGVAGAGADALLLVGPEGGFSNGELERLASNSWRRLALGPHVLRSETAAVVGAAMLCALFEHAPRQGRLDI